MRILAPIDIPIDYEDFRQSESYRRAWLYPNVNGMVSHTPRPGRALVGQPGRYGCTWTIGPLTIANFRSATKEPDIAELRTHGWHGFAFWIPWRGTIVPQSWRLIPWPWRSNTQVTQGLSIVHNDYQQYWNQRTRRNLVTWQRAGGIIETGSRTDFINGLAKATLTPAIRQQTHAQLDVAYESACHYILARDITGI